jgi:phosphonate transport system permease protein
MSSSWRHLHQTRPRQQFVSVSLRLFFLITVASWLAGDFSLTDWWHEGRQSNLTRFLEDVRPYPVQTHGWDLGIVAGWIRELWVAQGQQALVATLAISVAAISGAGLMGAVMSLPAARVFARRRPFLPQGTRARPWEERAWSVLVHTTRGLLVFLRSVPEYVWAYLLLAMLGPTFWPLVLALVLHNAGILGKLGSEVVENTGTVPSSALRASGAGRFQIALGSLFPLTLPRFLLYFFYRWETCVREATVLGMLGVTSLGFFMVEARAGNRYDELVFFVVLGSVLVMAGDLVSALVRRWVRSS